MTEPTVIGNATLHLGDCLDVLRTFADNSVDSIVTDPPYGLNFMGKKWDYDVPSDAIWRECLRVLKPGGHLLAFAGTRTQHRMACRIEDAGFEIRDMIAWVYGSGFPKSLDVSKAIDAAAGATREVVGVDPRYVGMSESAKKALGAVVNGECKSGFSGDPSIVTAPATEAAKQWQGWGTALKPSLEPITLARKPLIGTVSANMLEHGTGALNIDASRVEYAGTEDAVTAAVGTERFREQKCPRNGWRMADQQLDRAEILAGPAGLGRWPANLIHDGSDEVSALFPQAKGQQGRALDDGTDSMNAVYGKLRNVTKQPDPRCDTGSASRFFYCAKADREDRNEGCDALPQKVGGMVSNTSGQHMTRRDEGYQAKPLGNHHPTVKPTDLMRYLQRLVTPPHGVTLDLFMGSGSSGKAAMLEDLRFIGIERDPAYFAIACARIEHSTAQGSLFAPMASDAQPVEAPA